MMVDEDYTKRKLHSIYKHVLIQGFKINIKKHRDGVYWIELYTERKQWIFKKKTVYYVYKLGYDHYVFPFIRFFGK